jgi:hypothetical protein
MINYDTSGNAIIDPLGRVITSIRPFVTETGVTYTPWTDGTAVGFRADHVDGRIEFLYLNPSNDSGDEDETPNVFLYHGPSGDTGNLFDSPVCHVDMFTSEQS